MVAPSAGAPSGGVSGGGGAHYLHEHNVVADAGVGIIFAGDHPFSVKILLAGGPAEKSGVIKVGDMLEKVDKVTLQPHLTGDQVRALVNGPKDSMVELQFRESPKRTPPGAYRVRLYRKPADLQGLTAAATSLDETRGAMVISKAAAEARAAAEANAKAEAEAKAAAEKEAAEEAAAEKAEKAAGSPAAAGATSAMRNGKLPLEKFADGNAYEGEWLNGMLHGRGICTWFSGER
jgi:hypothetical protein